MTKMASGKKQIFFFFDSCNYKNSKFFMHFCSKVSSHLNNFLMGHLSR